MGPAIVHRGCFHAIRFNVQDKVALLVTGAYEVFKYTIPCPGIMVSDMS